MNLSGHSAISSVQFYIQTDSEAQRKHVNAIYQFLGAALRDNAEEVINIS